jgi:hypothetical protein
MGTQGGLLRPGSFEQSLGQVTLAALGPAHHGVKERRRQGTPPERLRSVKGCLKKVSVNDNAHCYALEAHTIRHYH